MVGPWLLGAAALGGGLGLYEGHKNRKHMKKYGDGGGHGGGGHGGGKFFPGIKGKKGKKLEKQAAKAYKKGMKGQHFKFERFSKKQQKLLKQAGKLGIKDLKHLMPLNKIHLPTQTGLFKEGKSALKDLLSTSPKAYKKFAAPALREFKERLVPDIMEKFGEGGRGSAERNAMYDAARMLEENLNAQKVGMKAQAIGPALAYAQVPLQEQAQLRGIALGQQGQVLGADPYMQGYIPPTLPGLAPRQMYQPQPGFMGQLGGALAGGLGMYGGMALGNAMGNWFGGGGGAAAPAAAAAAPQMPARMALPNFLNQ